MIKCLIYCTKDKNNQLYRYYGNKYDVLKSKQHTMPQPDFYLNGKIVAQFDCEKVEEIFYNGWWECYANDKDDINCNIFDNEPTCLTTKQIKKYLGDKKGYEIHISNLEVFDRPYDLYEWFNKDEKPLTKAPQNMCYCYHWLGDEYILISIKPEWVEKILNGCKTIEVRKSIVNKLKELI